MEHKWLREVEKCAFPKTKKITSKPSLGLASNV